MSKLKKNIVLVLVIADRIKNGEDKYNMLNIWYNKESEKEGANYGKTKTKLHRRV